MVKHTQKISPQKLTNCLSVFDHFVGLALKGLTEYDLTHFALMFQLMEHWYDVDDIV